MAALLPILTSSNYTESQILEQTIWTWATDSHRLDASGYNSKHKQAHEHIPDQQSI